MGTPENAATNLGFDPTLLERPTLNTGCVGATVENWEKMRSIYNGRSQQVKEFSHHYARQQFLMSLITYSSFAFSLMPKYTHCDGHYCIPDNIVKRNSVWMYEDNSFKIPAFLCHGGILMDSISDDERIYKNQSWGKRLSRVFKC
jgi:hypothetical protein